METRKEIEEIIRSILQRKAVLITAPEESNSLYQDGIGLDSLDTAELSAALELRFGHDPYSQGRFVRTFGELLAYYRAGAAQP